MFTQKRYVNQKNENKGFALTLSPEFQFANNDETNLITIKPFARKDSIDNERNKLDFKELNYQLIKEDYDFTIGVTQVFWGVTESINIVDSINQKDSTASLNNKKKLGQPMIRYRFYSDIGDVILYLLPFFREFEYNSYQKRLGFNYPISKKSIFNNGASKNHIDYSLRYQNSVNNFDLGISYFSGVNRDPFLKLDNFTFIPIYYLTDKLSIDLQYTSDEILYKLEVLHQEINNHKINAYVAGIEYSIYQIFNNNDLGLLLEYQHDDREISLAPLSTANNDFFLGLRYSLNDEDSSEFLIGLTQDIKDQSKFFFLEGEKRIKDNLKIAFESYLFCNIKESQPFFSIKNDDHIVFKLIYSF